MLEEPCSKTAIVVLLQRMRNAQVPFCCKFRSFRVVSSLQNKKVVISCRKMIYKETFFHVLSVVMHYHYNLRMRNEEILVFNKKMAFKFFDIEA